MPTIITDHMTNSSKRSTAPHDTICGMLISPPMLADILLSIRAAS